MQGERRGGGAGAGEEGEERDLLSGKGRGGAKCRGGACWGRGEGLPGGGERLSGKRGKEKS